MCLRPLPRALPPWVTSYEDLLASASPSPPEVLLEPDDIAKIIYTGGTTGRPRGAVWTHQAWCLVASLFLMEFGFHRDEVTALTGPLSHATMLFVLPTLLKGGELVILKSFDPLYLLQLITQRGITMAPLFPTMIYMLLDLPQTRKTDFSSLCRVFYGASPMSPERLEEALSIFGRIFIQLYGQTECLGITYVPAEDHRTDTDEARRRLASCGRPFIGSEIRLLDTEGKEVSIGEVGEIVLRNPYRMREYWNRPKETQMAIRNGWVHTGDLARMDEEGYYYIVDRAKDMIITGGFNVYSTEVESILAEHPAVAQVAVIGVPDPKWGEALKACVVLRPGASATEAEFIEFVRQRRGPVQAPKSVDFLDAMPLTQALKPDKKVLREPYWKGRERAIS